MEARELIHRLKLLQQPRQLGPNQKMITQNRAKCKGIYLGLKGGM